MSYEEYKIRISSFYKDHKRMPTYREIMSLVGFKSKNAAYKLVQRLVQDRIVSQDSSGRLAPSMLMGEIKVLGLVEAGFPSVAEEELIDTMSIDDYLIGNREATYLLRVKGDSMIGAGINEGDYVIAERGKQPKDGDIVIAEVDGEWTMKYLRKKAGRVFLEAANKKYPLIFPTQEMRVAAIVKGVVRKY